MRFLPRLVVASAFFAATALSAQSPQRGMLAILNGTDTLVTDRFVRTAESLEGTVRVTGQARIDYAARLATGDQVSVLNLAIFAPAAPADAAPVQRVRISMVGDTAVAEVSSGSHRIPTRAGAIPMFNNALALSELFIRRGRRAGREIVVPYFAIAGGATLDLTVTPVGADSMTTSIAGQVQRLHVDGTGRLLGGTIAGTPFRFVRVEGGATDMPSRAATDAAIAPAADYSAPAGAPYTAEHVRIAGPAGMLAGTLTRPRDVRGRVGVVVTISGSGQQDRDEYIPFAGGIRLFRELADTLGRRGIAVLRMDDRGIGGSQGGETLAASTSEDFAADVRAAVAWLRSRADVDPDRIVILGHSEGGAIAPMIIAGDPRIRALVTMAAPGEPGIEISMAQNRHIVERNAALTPRQRDSILTAARVSLAPERQTVPWIRFWMSYDPAPVARRVRVPVLVLQGATDTQVPPDQAEKLATLIRAGGNRDVIVRVFPAVNHLFVDDPDGDFSKYDQLRSNRVSKAVLGALADWLAERLR